ncbi:MAG: carboxypeptidase regulatory-like domain-containing protein [Planctomycetota bacterium]|jgi:protocatechuate 3,4-dioxygenase beta subunit
MKPVHLVVAGAVLAVVGILGALLLDGGGRRSSGRSATERRETDRTAPVPEPQTKPDTAPATGCRISVTVRMPDGAPASGADILVAGIAEHSGRAGADGGFSVELEPGRWSLAARKGDAVGALDVTVDRTTDLGTLRLEVGLAVRGHVFDVHGDPIAGAAVEAVPVVPGEAVDWYSYSARMSEPDLVFSRTRSGKDGAYELLAPAGHYSLRARADGYAASIDQDRGFAADLQGIDFYLVPGRRIEGRVVGSDDSPLAGALVTMSGYVRFGDLPAKTFTTTDAEGRFAIVFNDARTNRLTVRSPGYAPYSETKPRFRDGITVRLARGFAIRMRATDAKTGAPAAGVPLTVTNRSETRSARTDAEGLAMIERLPEVTDLRRADLTVLAGGGAWVPQRIDLREHRIDHGLLDLGDVEMSSGATVTGTVRDAVSGAPVAGARVRAVGGRLLQYAELLNQVVTSDERGHYELTGVAPDVAAVLAAHPDYVHDIDPGKLGGMLRGRGKPLLAEGQESATIDLTLAPAAGVSGVVLRPDGQPATGAHVRRRFAARGFNSMIGGTEPSAFTDAQGRFDLRGFRQGTDLELVATHRAFGASKAIKAKAGTDTDVTLRLAAPVSLGGAVVDEEGQPVANVKIRASLKAKGRRGAFGADAIAPGLTDALGRFTIRNVGVGEMNVSFTHDDYETVQVTHAVDGSQPTVDLGSTTMRRGNGIAGVVVDSEGRPRAGVVVNATWGGTGGGFEPSRTQRTWGGATTDALGRFAMYGLRDGPYRLMLGRGDLYADRPLVRTGTVDVRLVALSGATLQGRVVAAGLPVEGAFVQAHVTGVDRKRQNWFDSLDGSRTDKDGRFALRRLPPKGAFTLMIRHTSYKTTWLEGITAAHDGRTFALDAGITLAGVVAEPDGTPVGNANVAVHIDGKQAKWARTGADGRFEFGGLETGLFEVQVAGSTEGHIKSGLVGVKAGDSEIRIVVERGLEIAGTITSARKQVVFRVEVIAADGATAADSWAAPGRKFRVRGLRPGRYTLRISVRTGEGIEPVTEIENVEAGGKELTIEVD